MSEKIGVISKPMSRDEALAILAIKTEEGQEQLNPEEIMNVSKVNNDFFSDSTCYLRKICLRKEAHFM